jgi:hypothetical protein
MNTWARNLVAADLIGLIENIANPKPSKAEMAKRIERQEQAEYDFEEAFWDRQNGRREDDNEQD